jgi:hypothetical protein
MGVFSVKRFWAFFQVVFRFSKKADCGVLTIGFASTIFACATLCYDIVNLLDLRDNRKGAVAFLSRQQKAELRKATSRFARRQSKI